MNVGSYLSRAARTYPDHLGIVYKDTRVTWAEANARVPEAHRVFLDNLPLLHRTEAAVFEPVHGSAPKYAGLNKANPTALILSGVLMLRHLGEQVAAERVETAIRAVIAEGLRTTYDLGGEAGTSEFADAIIERMAASTPPAPAGADAGAPGIAV